MTTEQIEHEAFSESALEGQLQLPNERIHLFSSLSQLHKWAEAFNITNYTVHSGYRQDNGEYVLQLTYQPVNN